MATSQKPKGWFSKDKKKTSTNSSHHDLRSGMDTRSAEETMVEEHFVLKKAEGKKKSLELKEGRYRLEFNVAERFMPTRYAEGTVTLTDKSGKLIQPGTSFAVRGSSILGNRWKCRFAVPAVAAPVTLAFDLTCHTVRSGSELTIGYTLIKVSSHVEGDSFFEFDGEVIDGTKSDRRFLEESAGMEADLGEDERRHILEAFKEADKDGSGELDFEEFYLLLKKLYPSLSLPDANRIYARVDKDRSNSISETEFLEAVAYYRWDVGKIPKIPAGAKPKAPPPFEWEIPYEELQIGAKLGEGAFGIVYKAKWRGIAVAVKELKYTNLTPEVLEEFRKEISILAKLRHPNVVLFMGASTQPPHLTMVTEYLSGGNLYEVLHEKKTRINPVMLVQMAWQTALGLNYLHLSTPQILHRDLKPMNLLLDSNANVKLCDFGLSCVKEKKAVVTESVGSPFWMAPEVLMGKPYNEKADVYSFGVLLYEFLTGVIPMSETVVDEKSLQKVLQQICAGTRAPIPPHIPSELSALITATWANDANKRPNFSDVVDKLEAIHGALSQQAMMQKLSGGSPQPLYNQAGGAAQQPVGYQQPMLSQQRTHPQGY